MPRKPFQFLAAPSNLGLIMCVLLWLFSTSCLAPPPLSSPQLPVAQTLSCHSCAHIPPPLGRAQDKNPIASWKHPNPKSLLVPGFGQEEQGSWGNNTGYSRLPPVVLPSGEGLLTLEEPSAASSLMPCLSVFQILTQMQPPSNRSARQCWLSGCLQTQLQCCAR